MKYDLTFFFSKFLASQNLKVETTSHAGSLLVIELSITDNQLLNQLEGKRKGEKVKRDGPESLNCKKNRTTKYNVSLRLLQHSKLFFLSLMHMA